MTGLVLVDSSHEDQHRYPLLQQQTVKSRHQLSSCQPSAPFGIVRLFGLLDGFAAKYPPAAQPVVKANLYQTRFCRSMADEYAALDESFAQIDVAGQPIENLPLVVLTHGLPLPDPQTEHDWQALLFALLQALPALFLSPVQAVVWVVAYSFLGVGLINGWAAVRTNSIWSGLIAATLMNLTVTILFYKVDLQAPVKQYLPWFSVLPPVGQTTDLDAPLTNSLVKFQLHTWWGLVASSSGF